MYAELGKMSTEIEAIDGGHGGSVTLGAVAGAFPAIVARAVTQMRRPHPALSNSRKENGLLDGRHLPTNQASSNRLPIEATL
ncbi:hypothetical protein CDEF62S_00744 [Castellaniella defragrans]